MNKNMNKVIVLMVLIFVFIISSIQAISPMTCTYREDLDINVCTMLSVTKPVMNYCISEGVTLDGRLLWKCKIKSS